MSKNKMHNKTKTSPAAADITAAALADLPEGITVVSLNDPAELHNTLAGVFGEQTIKNIGGLVSEIHQTTIDEVISTERDVTNELNAAEDDKAKEETTEESLGLLPAPLPELPAPTPVPTVIKGRRISYNSNDHIIIMPKANGNPKKIGTDGWFRFKEYRTGMTVEQYCKLTAIGKYGRADIRWDIDRGFITMVSADRWPEVNEELLLMIA